MIAVIGVLIAVIANSLTSRTPPPVSEKVQQAYEDQVKNVATPGPTTRAAAAPTAAARSTFTLEDVKKRLASGDSMTISVMGDSTGNSGGEWVDLWAQNLAAYASVTLHMWDEKAEDWIPQTIIYGSGPKAIEIWNGSHPGASVEYGLSGLSDLQPAQPDLVIFNYGHNQSKTKVGEGLGKLSQDIDAKWSTKIPAVMTIQNPSQGDRAAMSALSAADITEWASAHGFPVIDVGGAFDKSDSLPALLRDSVHPNDAGSRIWADTVIATIG